MGKSNKFDYTNRSSSGVKLGHIIGTALVKEAEKVKKDGEKRMRKCSVGSAGAVNVEAVTHVIHLLAPNKDLGDEGVCAMAEDLEEALKTGVLVLDEVCLAGNRITTVSLARLAPVIELAARDLRTLNLPNNAIKVETEEEAKQFEVFCNAFRRCEKIEKVDLSGNVELGASGKGMEVLARVHGRERIDEMLSREDNTMQDSMEQAANHENEHRSSHHAAQESGPHMAQNGTLGLHFTSQIILHDVSLVDAAALWLSYVIEDHADVNYERNIDWTGNEKTLGKEGKALLERAEACRRRASAALVDGYDDVDGVDSQRRDSARKISLDRRHSKSSVRSNRRASIRSSHNTCDDADGETTEMDSVRKRIQRQIIVHHGAAGVELWRQALTLFRTARMLLFIAPRTQEVYGPGPQDSLDNRPEHRPNSPASNIVAPRLRIDTNQVQKDRAMSSDGNLLSPFHSARTSPSTKFLSPNTSAITKRSPSELALTEVTNTPATPLRLQRPTHRKDAFSEGTEDGLTVITGKLHGLGIQNTDHEAARLNWRERSLRYQQAHITANSALAVSFRDEDSPCHLPQYLIERIAGSMQTLSASVLSPTQRRAIIARAHDRHTLREERDWVKWDESVQVWMLLESVGCLEYEHKAV